MHTDSVHKLTTLALFTTLALAIYAVESAIPPLVPIPGIKPGLANIITLVVLTEYSGKDALYVLLARILLSTLLFGQAMSLLYSLAGGVLCFLIMCLTNRLLQGHFLFLTGILGAVFHNLGQLSIAFVLTSTPGVLSYLPFLILGGILTGLFTGLSAGFMKRYLRPLTSRKPSAPKGGDGNSVRSPREASTQNNDFEDPHGE